MRSFSWSAGLVVEEEEEVLKSTAAISPPHSSSSSSERSSSNRDCREVVKQVSCRCTTPIAPPFHSSSSSPWSSVHGGRIPPDGEAKEEEVCPRRVVSSCGSFGGMKGGTSTSCTAEASRGGTTGRNASPVSYFLLPSRLCPSCLLRLEDALPPHHHHHHHPPEEQSERDAGCGTWIDLVPRLEDEANRNPGERV